MFVKTGSFSLYSGLKYNITWNRFYLFQHIGYNMLKNRAGDRARTGDNQLGRLKLYQLSYSRLKFFSLNKLVGRAGFEPAKVSQQSYSLSSLAAWVSPLNFTIFFKDLSRWRDSNPRPADYKSAALASWATSAFLFYDFLKKHIVFNLSL